MNSLLQKLQDHLHEVGQRIKHHEENVKYLKSLKNKLEELILNMQGIIIWSCFSLASNLSFSDIVS